MSTNRPASFAPLPLLLLSLLLLLQHPSAASARAAFGRLPHAHHRGGPASKRHPARPRPARHSSKRCTSHCFAQWKGARRHCPSIECRVVRCAKSGGGFRCAKRKLSRTCTSRCVKLTFSEARKRCVRQGCRPDICYEKIKTAGRNNNNNKKGKKRVTTMRPAGFRCVSALPPPKPRNSKRKKQKGCDQSCRPVPWLRSMVPACGAHCTLRKCQTLARTIGFKCVPRARH